MRSQERISGISTQKAALCILIARYGVNFKAINGEGNIDDTFCSRLNHLP